VPSPTELFKCTRDLISSAKLSLTATLGGVHPAAATAPLQLVFCGSAESFRSMQQSTVFRMPAAAGSWALSRGPHAFTHQPIPLRAPRLRRVVVKAQGTTLAVMYRTRSFSILPHAWHCQPAAQGAKRAAAAIAGADDDADFEARLAALKTAKGETPYGKSSSSDKKAAALGERTRGRAGGREGC
jgi:hypothetical protein